MEYDEGEGGCYDNMYDDTSYDIKDLFDWKKEYVEEMSIRAEAFDDLQDCWGETTECIVILIDGVRTCVTHHNPYDSEENI